MPPTTGYSFGDVVLVPFPFTNQAGTKKRPAVIISSAGYNTAQRDLIIMAVTSQLRRSGVFGESHVADWEAAGLIKPSAIKPIITTIEQHSSFGASASLQPKISRRSEKPSRRSSAKRTALATAGVAHALHGMLFGESEHAWNINLPLNSLRSPPPGAA